MLLVAASLWQPLCDGLVEGAYKGFYSIMLTGNKNNFLVNMRVYFSFLPPPPILITPKQSNSAPPALPTGWTSSPIHPSSPARFLVGCCVWFSGREPSKATTYFIFDFLFPFNSPSGAKIQLLWSMALKTLQCCGDSSSLEQRSTLRAIQTLNPPPKYIHKLRGLSSIHSKHWRGVQGLMWGARGPFLPAGPWLWRLWRQLCLCQGYWKKTHTH